MAVLDAAGRCFLERGYAATTMKDVAAAAGVSVPTVFAQGGKAALLLACVDRALVGDDEDAPLLARELFVQLAEAPDKAGKLAALQAIAIDRGPATTPMLRAFEAAAAADPELAAAWTEYEGRRYADMRAIAGMLAPWLRPGLDADAAADIAWATFGLETAERLLRDRGWSAPRYAEWFADAVDRLLLR
ncbi:helix-turn-helix domain-containing protein [Trujillonella endophytica]|uniref:helix-turn-helix domain-containing protein n=1 Tax=Trujillonella endophytica TaxID=673521 RepID=UPI001481C2F7|nr:TetR/AcrR family transcriptional regulator [Trujillella endophytica]